MRTLQFSVLARFPTYLYLVAQAPQKHACVMILTTRQDGPLTLKLPEGAAPLLALATTARADNGIVHIGQRRIDLRACEQFQSRLPPLPHAADWWAALEHAALPHLHRSDLLRDVLQPPQNGASAQRGFALLARGIHRHCHASLRRGTGELAGLGLGLTPAGDDFLCGLMLALHVAHPAPRILCRTIMAYALPATTTLSGAFLRAAAAGHAMPQWHRLLADGPSPSSQVVVDILRHGHSSGGDSLAGFIWGARVIGIR